MLGLFSKPVLDPSVPPIVVTGVIMRAEVGASERPVILHHDTLQRLYKVWVCFPDESMEKPWKLMYAGHLKGDAKKAYRELMRAEKITYRH